MAPACPVCHQLILNYEQILALIYRAWAKEDLARKHDEAVRSDPDFVDDIMSAAAKLDLAPIPRALSVGKLETMQIEADNRQENPELRRLIRQVLEDKRRANPR